MKGLYPFYEVETIESIRDMLEKSCRNFGPQIAIQSKVQGKYRPVTYNELWQRVAELSSGLETLGMRQGTKVGIVGENSTEWAITYLAVACSGAVCVPIDKDLKKHEIQHILEFSGTEMLVAAESYLEGIREIRPRLPALKTVICSTTGVVGSDALPLAEILEPGRRALVAGTSTFQSAKVLPDQLAAIIFTSGTMGRPKGVMLSHRNICSNIMDTCRSIYIDSRDHFLSVLPVHHTYECTAGFLIPLFRGAVISYCENLRRVAENMAETRATVMLGVPLLFEAIYKRIQEGIRAKGETKFRIALTMAAVFETPFRRSIRKKLFNAVHSKFGGRLRLLISGGAAINPEVAYGFRQLGIHFVQGYGMTEASPIIAVNRDRAFRDSAAGLPLAGVEVKIEDGEILARGDNIMQGYYHDPQATAATLLDGWLRTGDLGELDADGFLYVRGRMKAVIVTSGGKKIYPEEIETELMHSALVAECLVCEGRDHKSGEAEVRALVVPNFEAIAQKLQRPADAVPFSEVESLIQAEIRRISNRLAPYKRIRQLEVRREEFSKTTTRKVKRYLYVQQARQAQASQSG